MRVLNAATFTYTYFVCNPRHETTASEARADAPDAQVARQVEAAANLEHQAAEQAASVAKVH